MKNKPDVNIESIDRTITWIFISTIALYILNFGIWNNFIVSILLSSLIFIEVVIIMTGSIAIIWKIIECNCLMELNKKEGDCDE